MQIMSAESPRKTTRHGGYVVSPQPVSDRSIIESVAGFINDVVPQGYVSSHPTDHKESIVWARFEHSDINDPCLYPEWDRGGGGGGESSVAEEAAPPLLLALGLGGGGAQVWVVAGEDGQAREVLSWRQGMVRTLRILPSPECPPGASPDAFPSRRPLVALCDSAAPGPPFCSVSFISLRGGEQIKSIKFKNPVSDILANRRVVAVTFLEKIAVFDACTLEDRFTVSSCYPCPGPNPNPVALGSRWMAYAERRLIPSRRSAGGVEGSSAQSYTATVLHAAKSLTRGLRELGETVASSLGGGQRSVTGTREADRIMGSDTEGSSGSPPHPGVISILDVWGVGRGETDPLMEEDTGHAGGVVAHFLAHTSGDPIVALSFDPSGPLLLTADRAGHDFHIFRIHPGFGPSSSTAVHHLYVLHRGDTTAKVQDIAFSMDSRWVAVSTLRGTAHVFPLTPYGGPVGVRTHTAPHVVNRASRFHRSAGLDSAASHVGDPHSPIAGNGLVGSGTCSSPTSSTLHHHMEPAIPYPNPRLPPFPHPTTVMPLARLRQPSLSGSMPSSVRHSGHHASHTCRLPAAGGGSSSGGSGSGSASGRGSGCRGSGPEEGIPLRVTACFAPSRAWVVGSPTVGKERCLARKAVDSLFVMACHGNLMEYSLEPKPAPGIPKEKVFDDSPIMLEVCPRARWNLLPRPPHHSPSPELQPPLPASNPLLVAQERAAIALSSPPSTPHLLPTASNPSLAAIVSGSQMNAAQRGATMSQGAIVPRPQGNSHHHAHSDERWLSQVEIITHAGPHRRLWMGPQFVFKTYNCTLSGPSIGMEAPDPDASQIPNTSGARHNRSDPVGMPGNNRGGPLVPVVIESGSGSSFEQSPRLLEAYSSAEAEIGSTRIHASGEWRVSGSGVESRLREDLADAMMEGPGLPVRDTGPRRAVEVWFETDKEWEEIGFSTPKGRRRIAEEQMVAKEVISIPLEEENSSREQEMVREEEEGDCGEGLTAAGEGIEGEKVVLEDEDAAQQKTLMWDRDLFENGPLQFLKHFTAIGGSQSCEDHAEGCPFEDDGEEYEDDREEEHSSTGSFSSASRASFDAVQCFAQPQPSSSSSSSPSSAAPTTPSPLGGSSW
ncbi:hypothetical protein J437_LFUL007498 [Ladona fulva]|uniref:BCAS3 WD40 domain-containing protein n=1 Tax=Ladona fulva TaxID=123851 RepID=A0A8K0KGM5_LADFU|nr:hypothetical protein J437_LFUL007498 [Ladona fulva]